MNFQIEISGYKGGITTEWQKLLYQFGTIRINQWDGKEYKPVVEITLYDSDLDEEGNDATGLYIWDNVLSEGILASLGKVKE